MTLFFTGLPDDVMLFLVFEAVEPFITVSAVSALSAFEQFVLCLIKLRLNFPFKFFAYLFGISPTTASNVFYTILNILYEHFKTLVTWPEREELQKTMPYSFQEKFGKKVTTIIDCFEIFIERPSNFRTASACWSNYKHHYTLKILIGICPQGCVTFISGCYGGRISDKEIVEDSTLLEHLLPGDKVMADRGFTIYDLVHAHGAELEIPAFTKGKLQLSALEIEKTREIAHVRIHVERVIGSLRQKYTILDSEVPITALHKRDEKNYAFDKIVTVCSAFLNLCPSVVPLDI